MSKIDKTFLTKFLEEVWEAPNGRLYIGDTCSSYSPEYLIDVKKLIDYFREFDTVELIIAVQRLIVDFVKETARPANLEGYLSKAIYDRINEVSYFADVLDDCINRDAHLIDAYTHRKID